MFKFLAGLLIIQNIQSGFCTVIPNTNETSIELVFIVSTNVAFLGLDLKYEYGHLLQVFRHGERVPETNELFPNDQYSIEHFYPLTYGQVTKVSLLASRK